MTTLIEALADTLAVLFTEGKMASRRIIVQRLREKHRSLGQQDLDLVVAKRLNFLVQQEILQRESSGLGIRLYGPGPKMRERHF